MKDLRKQLWIDVAVVTARREEHQAPEASGRYADGALAAFDKTFPSSRAVTPRVYDTGEGPDEP